KLRIAKVNLVMGTQDFQHLIPPRSGPPGRGSFPPEDIVLVPGDISWGMNLEQSEADLSFLQRLVLEVHLQGQPRLLVAVARQGPRTSWGRARTPYKHGCWTLAASCSATSRGWSTPQWDGLQHRKRFKGVSKGASADGLPRFVPGPVSPGSPSST
ncbi:MAG: hypothetical protein MZV63_34430, partial [Marinilabiliales bacterium]|nr:hypothetical protein [Marinilabiliales bacterium]